MFAESPIKRRESTRINVGSVPIGGGAPIAVQSMTNTLTTDAVSYTHLTLPTTPYV